MERLLLAQAGYTGAPVSGSDGLALAVKLHPSVLEAVEQGQAMRLSVTPDSRQLEVGEQVFPIIAFQEDAANCYDIFQRHEPDWLVQRGCVGMKIQVQRQRRASSGSSSRRVPVPVPAAAEPVAAAEAPPDKTRRKGTKPNMQAIKTRQKKTELERIRQGVLSLKKTDSSPSPLLSPIAPRQSPVRRKRARSPEPSLAVRLAHLLALEPLSLRVLAARAGLRESSREFKTALVSVSDEMHDGTYTLKNHLYMTLEPSGWPYTPKERAKLDNLLKQKRLSRELGGRSTSPKQTRRFKRRQSVPEQPVVSPLDSAITYLKGVKKLSSDDEYEQCRVQFMVVFAECEQLELRIYERLKRYGELEQRLHECQDDAERTALETEIIATHTKEKASLKDDNVRFSKLHEVLRRAKRVSLAYATTPH